MSLPRVATSSHDGWGPTPFRRLCFTGPAPDRRVLTRGSPTQAARERSARPHGLVGRLRRDGSGRNGSLFGRYLQRQPHRTRRPGAAPSRRLVSKRGRRELLRLWLPARFASLLPVAARQGGTACTVAIGRRARRRASISNLFIRRASRGE